MHRSLPSRRLLAVVAALGSTSGTALWRQPPKWVLAHGLDAFGAEHELMTAVNATEAPRKVFKEGAHIILVQPKGDKLILRIEYESRKRYALQRYIQSDAGVMVDIGANLGYVAIAVAKLHPNITVLAIEPAPLTFFYFLWNCWLNMVRISVDPREDSPHQATTDTQVTLREDMVQRDLKAYSCGRGKHQKGEACLKRPSIQTISVPTVNVLKYLQRRGDPAGTVQLLKMDCEGCEIAFAGNASASVQSWFLDRTRVHQVVGEFHPDARAMFGKPEVNNADSLFTLRGCRGPGQNPWAIGPC